MRYLCEVRKLVCDGEVVGYRMGYADRKEFWDIRVDEESKLKKHYELLFASDEAAIQMYENPNGVLLTKEEEEKGIRYPDFTDKEDFWDYLASYSDKLKQLFVEYVRSNGRMDHIYNHEKWIVSNLKYPVVVLGNITGTCNVSVGDFIHAFVIPHLVWEGKSSL